MSKFQKRISKEFHEVLNLLQWNQMMAAFLVLLWLIIGNFIIYVYVALE